MTVPAAAAWIGVPYGTPMSIPSCMRPQRMPNGLVIGPCTGQMSPLAETPLPVESPDAVLRAWAAWIWAVSCALTCSSPLTSFTNSRSLSLIDARLCRSCARVETSACWLASRRSCTARCELVDEVGQARRGEEDGHRVRVFGLVDGDEAPIETTHRLLVLGPEEDEATALEPVELGQPRELLPVEREVTLEGDEPV